MPLIDLTETTEIEIEGDTYTIRSQISFYEDAQILMAGVSMQDALNQQGHDSIPTGLVTAERQLQRLKTYLVGWSHPEPLTDENLKRIPASHARVIFAKIREVSGQAAPFRRQSDHNGVSD